MEITKSQYYKLWCQFTSKLRYVILFLVIRKWLTIIVLIVALFSVGRVGVYGQWDKGPLPPGGGGVLPGGVYPPMPTDYPIVGPTGEPEPDDPGPGNKYMYHCKYHECILPYSPYEKFLCSPAAADEEVFNPRGHNDFDMDKKGNKASKQGYCACGKCGQPNFTDLFLLYFINIDKYYSVRLF